MASSSRTRRPRISDFSKWKGRTMSNRLSIFSGKNDPGMFFAYNNGITATAEGVTTVKSSEGLRITKIANLQIVNGGQTTASIHAASRKKDVDLSNVFVQMSYFCVIICKHSFLVIYPATNVTISVTISSLLPAIVVFFAILQMYKKKQCR